MPTEEGEEWIQLRTSKTRLTGGMQCDECGELSGHQRAEDCTSHALDRSERRRALSKTEESIEQVNQSEE